MVNPDNNGQNYCQISERLSKFKDFYGKRFESLNNEFIQIRKNNSVKQRIPLFSDICKNISCNYFYETAAGIETDERVTRFYKSIKIG